MKDLMGRADALRAEYKVKESVPGSGYHDADRSAVPGQTHVFIAPQRNGLPKASEHLVAFTDWDEEIVHFVGDDADKAYACVKGWYDSNVSADLTNAPGTVRKLILKIVPKLSVKDVDGVKVFSVWLCDWNDVHWIMESAKIGLLGQPLK